MVKKSIKRVVMTVLSLVMNITPEYPVQCIIK